MRTTRLVYLGMVAVGVAALLSAYPVELGSQQNASVRIDKDDIGGVVRSAKGPEAGVWVIAETSGSAHEVRKDRRHRRSRALRYSRFAEGQLHHLGARLRARRFAKSESLAGQDSQLESSRGAE